MAPSRRFPRQDGIVSLLDAPASERVVGLWRGIEHRLGLRGIFVMPYPHFSYQIAEGYDRAAAEPAIEEIARSTPPFEVRTSGVASFGAPWPVVYLAVDRSPPLSDLHRRIWQGLDRSVHAPSPLYREDRWLPHVSLAYGDERTGTALTDAECAQVRALLGRGEYRWSLRVDNLALVVDDGSEQRPVRTFPLLGGQTSDVPARSASRS